MELGLHYLDFTQPGGPEAIGPTLAAAARAADEGGFTRFTMMDHYFQMEQFRTARDPMLEGYTGLGFVAGITEQMSLGLLVTGVTYRHPGLLAKIITTLDVLSGGRAVAGLGAAWYEREHLALGVPYPPRAERFERLEETLQICLQMWSDDDGPYEGTHYQLAETICVPGPIQRPHPPILIGGNGEQKTLRFVAEYGNACNLTVGDPAEVEHKLGVLRRHCDNAGTDYDAIEKTVQGGVDPLADPDGFMRLMERYAAIGVDLVELRAPMPDPVPFVTEVGATVVPRVADLG